MDFWNRFVSWNPFPLLLPFLFSGSLLFLSFSLIKIPVSAVSFRQWDFNLFVFHHPHNTGMDCDLPGWYHGFIIYSRRFLPWQMTKQLQMLWPLPSFVLHSLLLCYRSCFPTIPVLLTIKELRNNHWFFQMVLPKNMTLKLWKNGSLNIVKVVLMPLCQKSDPTKVLPEPSPILP